jgi:hypothetical protein
MYCLPWQQTAAFARPTAAVGLGAFRAPACGFFDTLEEAEQRHRLKKKPAENGFRWTPPPDFDHPVWTDRYSLLRAIHWR